MYSLSRINSVADCDKLLAMAEKEKSELTIKKISAERISTKLTVISLQIETLLQGVSAEITTLETIVPILPEGSSKEDIIKRKVRLEHQRFLLENRKQNFSPAALLEKELDLERINRALEEVNLFITNLIAFKAALQS